MVAAPSPPKKKKEVGGRRGQVQVGGVSNVGVTSDLARVGGVKLNQFGQVGKLFAAIQVEKVTTVLNLDVSDRGTAAVWEENGIW